MRGALGPFAQHILLDLAGAGLWQLRDDLDLPRHHKSTDAAGVFGPGDDIRAGDLLVGLDGNVGLGSLAPVGVRDGYDAGFENVWMRGQHRFESDRGYILSSCNPFQR